MRLEAFARPGVAVLNVNDTLNMAVEQMWELNIRHLPVVENGTLVGMVSDRDILFHVCCNTRPIASPDGKQAESLSGGDRIDQVMTKPVISLSPDDPVEKAARLMLNKKIGAIPLASGNAIFGIATETDFLKCFADEGFAAVDLQRQEAVVDYMSSHVFSVAPKDATLSAVRLMRDKQIRHLPVVDHGRLVGIISDRDVLRGAPPHVDHQPISVEELRSEQQLLIEGIMSPKVVTLNTSSTLASAAQEMVKHHIGAVPVVEADELLGIITETDLLRIFVTTNVYTAQTAAQCAISRDECAKTARESELARRFRALVPYFRIGARFAFCVCRQQAYGIHPMDIDIERICVPTDFSDAADYAIHYGASLARAHDAELHLLHVLEHTDALVHHPDFTANGEVARAYFNRMQVDAVDETPREDADASLNRETHEFLRSLEVGVDANWEGVEERHKWWEDLVVHRVARYGRPAEEICRYAEHSLIDLIVMPTHGRSGLARMLMGSVADRVIRTGACPVLVLRYPAHEHKMHEE